MSLRRALTVIVLLLVSGRSAVAAEPTIQVTEPAGIFIAPDNARQPLIQATAGMTLTLVRPEGIWLMVAWQDERFGRRTGYIEARFTDYAANRAAIARNTGPQVPVAARTESLPAAPVAGHRGLT